MNNVLPKLETQGQPRKRRLGIACGIVLIAYLGVYISLSIRGRYEPVLIDPAGVKQYDWAPKGFVQNFKWSHFSIRFYYPLYAIDCRFWHTTSAKETGRYPVNVVNSEEIGKVYRAWK